MVHDFDKTETICENDHILTEVPSYILQLNGALKNM